MRLTSFTFTEFPQQDNEWVLERLSLSGTNLLVGKNATGKSRTLNVINFLSALWSGQQKEVVSSVVYDVVFEDNKKRWEYYLNVENAVVANERLIFNGQEVLVRMRGSYGKILAEDIEDTETGETKKLAIKFAVPGSQVAVLAKRDDVQHSFLRPLHDWAESVRHFKLGWDIRPHELSLAVKAPAPIPVNEKDTSHLVPVFHKARKELGEARYDQAIIADMKELGYEIEGLAIRRPTNLVSNAILLGEFVGVALREKGLRCFVDQHSISQGMFRALSLLAQVNYYLLSKKGACILADDVGEGLDFERARALVGVLRRKAEESGGLIQLIMSTNDRFVMNHVPLTEWSVLQRSGHRVRVRNYENSREAFEEFKYTGLSNFDFFATDFLEEEEEVVASE